MIRRKDEHEEFVSAVYLYDLYDKDILLLAAWFLLIRNKEWNDGGFIK